MNPCPVKLRPVLKVSQFFNCVSFILWSFSITIEEQSGKGKLHFKALPLTSDPLKNDNQHLEHTTETLYGV